MHGLCVARVTRVTRAGTSRCGSRSAEPAAPRAQLRRHAGPGASEFAQKLGFKLPASFPSRVVLVTFSFLLNLGSKTTGA